MVSWYSTLFQRHFVNGIVITAMLYPLMLTNISLAQTSTPPTPTKFEPDIENGYDNTSIGCHYFWQMQFPNEPAYRNQQIEPKIVLAELNKQIQQEPHSFYLYNNRAILKRDRLEDYAGALADWDLALQIDKNSFTAYRNRALLKQDKLKDWQGAIADFDRAIQINPSDPELYNYRAILKATYLKDASGALADFNEIFQLLPDRLITDDRGNTLANTACWVSTDYAKVYQNRGLLKQTQLNDAAGALADYQQAQKIAEENNKPQHRYCRFCSSPKIERFSVGQGAIN
jgi:tetratricopeptide (TPR) repeat protein